MAQGTVSLLKISRGGMAAQVNLDNGQLCGLSSSGQEVMWRGGAPGIEVPDGTWRKSSLVACPIFGSAKDDTVFIDGKPYPMGKHGLSRVLPWKLERRTEDMVAIAQEYTANKEIEVRGVKSRFPISYRVVANYTIDDYDGAEVLRVELSVQNKSAEDMPFALGFHPAFAPSPDSIIVTIGGKGMTTILPTAVERTETMGLPGTGIVNYYTPEFCVTMTHNFGNTWLWKPLSNAPLCIEPITACPLDKEAPQKELAQYPGYRVLHGGESITFEADLRVLVRKL